MKIQISIKKTTLEKLRAVCQGSGSQCEAVDLAILEWIDRRKGKKFEAVRGRLAEIKKSEQILKDLKKLTNGEIAKKYKIGASTVSILRCSLKVPSSTKAGRPRLVK